jgi:hypothetical protein
MVAQGGEAQSEQQERGDIRRPRGISCHYRRGKFIMVDVKQAIQIAKEKAAEMLNQAPSNLEEIERDSYRGREVWSITLSLPRDIRQLQGLAALRADPLQYKRFLIDVETGELVAMKVREVASQ